MKGMPMGEAKWRKANDLTYGKTPKIPVAAKFSQMSASTSLSSPRVSPFFAESSKSTDYLTAQQLRQERHFRQNSTSSGDHFETKVEIIPIGNTDTNFRGLVVSCPSVIRGSGIEVTRSSLDPQCLRANLLFWDKLDWPTNNFIHVEHGPDEKFLESAGVLQRTRVTIFGGGGAGSGVLRAHLDAFKALDRAQSGSWSLSRDTNSISFEQGELEKDRGVLVSLFGSLPVPDQTVSLYEILEFKRKRRDELLGLRVELESLYSAIISSSDSEMALRTAQLRLEKALADHLKVAKEFPITWRFTDLKAKLNLTNGAVMGLLGYLVGQTITMPSLIAVVGAALGTIQVELSGGLKWKSNSKTPYEYITSYHKELFGAPLN
jgi:Family of unknown function (DUF6236)